MPPFWKVRYLLLALDHIHDVYNVREDLLWIYSAAIYMYRGNLWLSICALQKTVSFYGILKVRQDLSNISWMVLWKKIIIYIWHCQNITYRITAILRKTTFYQVNRDKTLRSATTRERRGTSTYHRAAMWRSICYQHPQQSHNISSLYTFKVS